jgi:hypothetical protein
MRLVPPYVSVGYRQMQQFGELTFATAKTSMYPSMKGESSTHLYRP